MASYWVYLSGIHFDQRKMQHRWSILHKIRLFCNSYCIVKSSISRAVRGEWSFILFSFNSKSEMVRCNRKPWQLKSHSTYRAIIPCSIALAAELGALRRSHAIGPHVNVIRLPAFVISNFTRPKTRHDNFWIYCRSRILMQCGNKTCKSYNQSA